MGHPERIAGVLTQGRQDLPQWVKFFTIGVSLDGTHWYKYADHNAVTATRFPGNSDQNSPVAAVFDREIDARFVRIYPESWHNTIALRFEVLSCYGRQTTTVQPPLVSGQTPTLIPPWMGWETPTAHPGPVSGATPTAEPSKFLNYIVWVKSPAIWDFRLKQRLRSALGSAQSDDQILCHVHTGERGGLVVNASDSGFRGRGFELHSGQTVLCP